MEIRRLFLSDLDSYFENRLRALQDSPSAFLTTYEEERERGNSHFAKTLAYSGNERVIFGAVDSGHVVATLGLFLENRPKIAHKAGIWGMFVDKDKRNLGLGGKLLDLAIQHARTEMRASGIYLSVEAKNISAKKLYESRGFRIWGTEPNAMSANNEFFDEDHMVLLLTKQLQEVP
jgi:RimJ/RimL family protein N-acetyltransferase